MIRVFVILLFMGVACKSQEKGKANDLGEPRQSMELKLLVSDNYGGSEHAEFRVIQDMKTLRQFFAQVNKTRKPGLPIPEVDFDKELLILHCPGKMMNGGTPKLKIKENTPDKIVFVSDDSDLEQKEGMEALTMPFSLYKIPLTGKQIVLQRE